MAAMRSLRSRLVLFWLLSVLAAASVGSLLVQFSSQSTTARVGRAEAVAARACDLIRERYTFYVTGWHGPEPQLHDPGLARDLTTVVTVALLDEDGVEGGIWRAGQGSLAYADPGRGAHVQLPAALLGQVRAVVERAGRDERAAAERIAASGGTLLLDACPLPGPLPDAVAWAAARVTGSAETDGLALGLGILLALAVVMAAGLAWLVTSWSRRIRGLEAALARPGGDHAPDLAATGDPDLDRVVAALNLSRHRLHLARKDAEALSAQVAAGQRLAALGRVAAGVAHEIRNPIATMRLRAENALAGGADHERAFRALRTILDQVARLDRLSGELLAMTQRRVPLPAVVDVAALLHGCVDDHAGEAAARGVSLHASGDGMAVLDEAMVRRALDNLVGNALRHTPRNGCIRLSAMLHGTSLRLAVQDSGPGVAPELHESLFEPFVTGRADGTGLGLAIAREMAEAHGGRLFLDGSEEGARFVMELPTAPATGEPWPPS